MLIRVDLIDATDRLRIVEPDQARFIAIAFEQEGQKSPIEVRPNKKKPARYLLVTGGHRLEAATLLGWEEIEAEVLDLSADEARLREINENLYRAELSTLDRAVFLAEKKRIYEKLHPHTKHGGNRHSEQVAIFGDLAPRFTEEVQERLGYSERTLQRVIARASIPAAVRGLIAGTTLARTGSELDALVKLAPDEQMQAVELLLSEDEDRPRNVAAAAARIRGERPEVISPEDAVFKKLRGIWKPLSKRERQRFVDYLIDCGDLTETTVAA